MATKKVKIIGKIRDSRFRVTQYGVAVRDDRYEFGQDHLEISNQIVLSNRDIVRVILSIPKLPKILRDIRDVTFNSHGTRRLYPPRYEMAV